MSEAERALVQMVFAWIDSFGPGRVDLQVSSELSDEDAIDVIAAVIG